MLRLLLRRSKRLRPACRFADPLLSLSLRQLDDLPPWHEPRYAKDLQ
jgi:hypothetical protein